jgi:hypothetical protein
MRLSPENLRRQAATQAVTVTPAAKPGLIDRLKGAATTRTLTVTPPPKTPFSPDDVGKAVYDAKREQGL